MRRSIFKILVILMGIIIAYNTKSYCVESGTKRIEITGGDPWTNITVSESYAECESLNSASSTLGTTTLRAHLTTDADWSAMAIFSISQYGGVTSNDPTTANGNVSGIYNPGKNWTYTTGILDTATSDSNQYIAGLFNSDGSLKQYMRAWPEDITQTDFVGFNETYGWFNSTKLYCGNPNASHKNHPISSKKGLFGVHIGWYFGYSTGGPSTGITFRPVIWN